MGKLIDTRVTPVSGVLDWLLRDKTMKRNILWATADYAGYGPGYEDTAPITRAGLWALPEDALTPRTFKGMAQRQKRTRAKAEVSTPAWVCNRMNNHLDERWFGRGDLFNAASGQSWTPTADPVPFPGRGSRRWQRYVDSRRLEITCGEAPFIVSRYDAATGEVIPIPRRVGLLDRKLRVVDENTCTEGEWGKWALRAVQSVYGYEWQGDSLLIARINVLMTVVEYHEARWHRPPCDALMKRLANVIAWNFFQMDGLKGTVPLGKPGAEARQVDLTDLLDAKDGILHALAPGRQTPPCRVFDWRAKRSMTFAEVGRQG